MFYIITKEEIYSGHTFGYNNVHYRVEDLIEYTKDFNIINFTITEDFLNSVDCNKMWGTLVQTSKNEIKIKPMTMLDFIKHMKRIDQVDLKYPIILIQEKNKLRLLDGNHRVVKAYLLKKKNIPSIILSQEDYIDFQSKYTKMLVDKDVLYNN